jgi:hypothetical protein
MTGDGIGGDGLADGIDRTGRKRGSGSYATGAIIDSEIAALRQHDIAASRLGRCKVDPGSQKSGIHTIGVTSDGDVAGTEQLVGDTDAASDADIAVTCQIVCL